MVLLQGKILARSKVAELLKTTAARLPEEVRNREVLLNLEAMANEIEHGGLGYVDDDMDPNIEKMIHLRREPKRR